MNPDQLDSKQPNPEKLWETLKSEAHRFCEHEPVLASLYNTLFTQQPDLVSALSWRLASLLDNPDLDTEELHQLFESVYQQHPDILLAACDDMIAYKERDAACDNLFMPFIYFKGFHALQIHRIAHHLFHENRQALAFFLQNMVSQHFSVDIHPAATIGSGIMIDHATGLVIGETAIVEDNVSILHSVTLGGTGTDCKQDRHPKIRHGVLLAAGAKVLGNVEVGEGAKIAAGSLVLEDVPPHSTVAGVPGKVVGHPTEDQPALSMKQDIEES